MQYFGGKAKIGKQIVQTIEPWREPGTPFVDVFCGALNVVRHAAPPRIAMDLCQPLITTLQAVIRGWTPPEHVAREDYQRIKASPDPWDPLTAFVMFGCSYAGKWGRGYQVNASGRNYARTASRSLRSKAIGCKDLDLFCLDYRNMPDPYPGLILYCDIPYRKGKDYGAVVCFNNDEFWIHAAWWNRCGAFVFVSEGAGAKPPSDWIIFKSWDVKASATNTGVAMKEYLYVHRESLMGRAKIMGLV